MKVALVGLHSRKSVWVFVWMSLAIALACIAYGLLEPIFLFGGLLLISALWYYRAILWVDRHGKWE